MSMKLSISMVEYQTIQVFKLRGYLAQLEVYKFKRLIEKAFTEGRRYLVVDMRDVEFIDSAGIATLIFLRKESMRMGGSPALVIPAGSGIRKVLDSANLAGFMPIHDKPEDALNEVIGMLPGHGPAAGDVADRIRQLSERLASLEQRIGQDRNPTQI